MEARSTSQHTTVHNSIQVYHIYQVYQVYKYTTYTKYTSVYLYSHNSSSVLSPITVCLPAAFRTVCECICAYVCEYIYVNVYVSYVYVYTHLSNQTLQKLIMGKI